MLMRDEGCGPELNRHVTPRHMLAGLSRPLGHPHQFSPCTTYPGLNVLAPAQ